MIGEPGSDTFVCDRFDIIVDFDPYEEGDEIIGSCSVDYVFEEEEELEEIPEFNNNIFPLDVEESERLPPSPLSSSSQLSQKSPNHSQPRSMNSFDMPSLSDVDLQSKPPPPIPPLDFYDFRSSLPKTNLQSSLLP